MAFPTYPATTLTEAVAIAIFSSNQMHELINSDSLTQIDAEDGPIPSIRKALTDNFYFLSPVAWDNGNTETIFNQLRLFGSLWYYAPTATVTSPVSMGSTPIGDSNWKLWEGQATTRLESTGSALEDIASTYSKLSVVLSAGQQVLDLRYDNLNSGTGNLLSDEEQVYTRQFFKATLNGSPADGTITGNYEFTLTSAAVGGENFVCWQNADDSSIDKIFPTVADADVNWLQLGWIVQTAGYNSVGDGGGNLYQVVAGGTGTDDGGSFIDMSASGYQLKGLFPSAVINAKQFGLTDGGDLATVQPAIDYCIANRRNLVVPKDDYTMSAATIRWPSIICVDFSGSSVQCVVGSKIKNQYIGSDPSSDNSYEGYRVFIKNLWIKGAGRHVAGSEVWFIGNESDLTNRDMGRCMSENMQVTDCIISQDYGSFDTYLITHHNCHLERAETLIRTPASASNSGENIKFTGNSIFSSTDYLIELGAPFDFKFIGSSIDFHAETPIRFIAGFNSVQFVGCYFEQSIEKGFASTSGAYTNMTVMIDDTVILPRKYVGYTGGTNAGNTTFFTGSGVDYVVNNFRVRREIVDSVPTNYDMAASDIRSLTFTGEIPDGNNSYAQSLGSSLCDNYNSDLEVGTSGDAINTTGIAGYVDSLTPGRYPWALQNTTVYSGSLAGEVTLGAQTFTEILTDKIPLSGSGKVICACKLHGGVSTGNINRGYVIQYYDINGTVIHTDTSATLNVLDLYNDTTSPLYTGARNYWIGIQPYRTLKKIPGAVEVDVQLTLSAFTGQIFFDDFCVDIR